MEKYMKRGTSFGGNVNKRVKMNRSKAVAGAAQILLASSKRFSQTRIRREIKTLDVPETTITIRNMANCVCSAILPPVVGSDFFNRLGNKIQWKSIRIQGFIEPALSATSLLGDKIRLIIYWDASPNGAVPLITDLLQDVQQSGAKTTNINSGLNMANSDRFRILRDWDQMTPVVTTSGTTVTASIALDQTICFKYDLFVNLKGATAQMKGTTGNIADYSSGALGFVVMCRNDDATWAMTSCIRTRYYDV